MVANVSPRGTLFAFSMVLLMYMQPPWDGILYGWCGIMILVGHVLEFCTGNKTADFTI
jgi:hypothetical protein